MREDHPGALLEILTEFSVRGVNLTRIESRPTRKALGDYYFSVDCEGHVADARVGEALAGLHRICAHVRFLGSYPRHDGKAPLVRAGVTDDDFAEAEAWLSSIRGPSWVISGTSRPRSSRIDGAEDRSFAPCARATPRCHPRGVAAPSMKYAVVEREHRFVVLTAPDPSLVVRTLEIDDRYLHGTRLRLRRVREAGAPDVLKLGQKVRFEEHDPAALAHTTIYLDAAEYDALCALPGDRVVKTRHHVPLDVGHVLAVDRFHGALDGLVLAELDLGADRVLPTHAAARARSRTSRRTSASPARRSRAPTARPCTPCSPRSDSDAVAGGEGHQSSPGRASQAIAPVSGEVGGGAGAQHQDPVVLVGRPHAAACPRAPTSPPPSAPIRAARRTRAVRSRARRARTPTAPGRPPRS